MASPPPSPPHAKKPKVSDDDNDDGSDTDAPVNGLRPPIPANPETGKPRYKRRKVAIFFGYCGAGYQGMQKNPGAKTIESDLEEALFLSWAVPEADRGCPRRWDWARSARTDKGVSAVGQVVSGRFYVDPPGFVERLNSHLAPQIRIFGYKRATSSFNAKKFCDRRRYVYLLPVFALDPEAHPNRESVMASLGSGNELAKCLECSERGRKVPGLMGRQLKGPRDEGGEERDELGNGGGGLKPLCSVAADVAVEEVKFGDVGDEKNKKGEENGGTVEVSLSEFALESEFSVEGERGKLGNGCPKTEGTDGGSAVLESEILLMESTEKVESAEVECGEKGDGLTVGGSQSSPETTEKEQTIAREREFRYGEKEKERLNRILKRYVGTHNFHNFTTRTKAEDPSARRYIISFDANTVVNMGGIEFIKCVVVGQSFMLHQIRKMIGFAVAIMRNCTSESLMDSALRQDVNINVPTAPEVGLYLEECLFSSYNQKWKDSHEELSMRSYAEEAEGFKMKYIYPHIASMEQQEGSVALWLHSLNRRNYPDFCFGEVNGASCAKESSQQDIMVESV